MRKHHNKLYYGKYRSKTMFSMPGSLMFYPTTDQYLVNLKKKYEGMKEYLDKLDRKGQSRAKVVVPDPTVGWFAGPVIRRVAGSSSSSSSSSSNHVVVTIIP